MAEAREQSLNDRATQHASSGGVQISDACLGDAQTRETVDLNGQFRVSVDAKGRVTLPAKFRRVLARELVVTLELNDECVYVFEQPDFNDWIKQLFDDHFGGYRSSNRQHVKLRRKLKARSDDVEIDSAGRIMLSPDVRRACGIEKEALIIGNTGYFEIWSAKRYDEEYADLDLSVFYEES